MTSRRGNKDIDRYLRPWDIFDMILKMVQPEGRDPELVARNRALIASLYITCGRINEVIRLRSDQFIPGSEYVEIRDYLLELIEDPERWIILTDFRVSKRKQKTIKAYGLKLLDIPIPIDNNSSWKEITPITGLLVDYLRTVKPGERLFPIERAQAWRIVKGSTGKWDHYFRAQALSYYVNKLGNPLAVSQIFGIENVNTLKWYYKGAWARYMA